MVNRVYLDASFFVATQILANPFYLKAQAILGSLGTSTIYFSPLTIDEIIYALSKYRISRAITRETIIKRLINVRGVKMVKEINEKKQLKLYIESWEHNALKPRDAMHLYLMKLNGITDLLSFNSKDFVNRQEELGIRVLGTLEP